MLLLKLLRAGLAPYKRWLAVIVVLQFVATVAILYLPSLNADIIDKGVATTEQTIWRSETASITAPVRMM